MFRGFYDLYVPILIPCECVATLVAGPILAETPSAEQIIASWAGLRGRAAERFDRELAEYARAMIHIPVLEARPLAAFRELLEYWRARWPAARYFRAMREGSCTCATRSSLRLPTARQFKGAVMLDPVSNSYFLEGKLTDWEVNEFGIRHIPPRSSPRCRNELHLELTTSCPPWSRPTPSSVVPPSSARSLAKRWPRHSRHGAVFFFAPTYHRAPQRLRTGGSRSSSWRARSPLDSDARPAPR